MVSARTHSTCLPTQGFIDSWTQLVSDILTAAPEAKGRLLLDMINEPDGYNYGWCVAPQHSCIPSLTSA